eukprot:jgi/Mesvir1/3665/Mv14956-RA.1
MDFIVKKRDEITENCKAWMDKQPPAVSMGITASLAALQGGLMGGFIGTMYGENSPLSPAGAPGGMQNAQAAIFAGGPLVQARNFGIMAGVNSLLVSVAKKQGMGEDNANMVGAFGSGATFALFTTVGGGNRATAALSTGVSFALLQGVFAKIGNMFSGPKPDDAYYVKSRAMLLSLGLGQYERNFRKGLLTDPTLPLITDSALKDCNIPPGPRLIILDHIQKVKARNTSSPPKAITAAPTPAAPAVPAAPTAVAPAS